MLSAIPGFLSSESILEDPFQAFESGFMLWDCSELFSPIQSPSPVISSSGSDELNQNQTNSNSNSNSSSNLPNQNRTISTSCSDEQNRPVSIVEERKRKRMISNRESARRSRMRKQKHLENLRNQANKLRIENRELTNRLRFILYHCHRVQTDNDRLRSEHIMLRQKLLNIRQILQIQQLQQYTSAWPQNNVASDITTSLIA
ncbi:bZIP_1 domain-containing protein [Cephalotus follicularis]|uniref:BZIP_1 domain-containing protein n=1 Tax=Cephalotus follicularis TaxID=3775 RepID=A0A1Q3AQA9_CEPFO|nr:bZIP_1 domain-containing protein [Cephalotus follicularis]